MPSFIVLIEDLDGSSDQGKLLGEHMAEAGFTPGIVGSNHIRYLLPRSVFHCTGLFSVEQILECVKRIAARSSKRYSVVALEVNGAAWAGLDVLGRDPPRRGSRHSGEPSSEERNRMLTASVRLLSQESDSSAAGPGDEKHLS